MPKKKTQKKKIAKKVIPKKNKGIDLATLKKIIASKKTVKTPTKPKKIKKIKLKALSKWKPGEVMNEETTISIVKTIEDQFEETEDAIFFLEWLKCGQNASKAYRNLHPEVTDHSARVLGSRQLAKVDKAMILEAFGLGLDQWLNQLKEGLVATKYVDTGFDVRDEVPDHRTRRAYHKVQGEILGIENPTKTEVNQPIQINFNSKKYIEEV